MQLKEQRKCQLCALRFPYEDRNIGFQRATKINKKSKEENIDLF